MDKDMSYGSDYKFLPVTSVGDGVCIQVLPDLFSYTSKIVNIVFVGDPTKEEFVMIDAGMPGCSKKIIETAEEIYGPNSRPKAIILTHGHFDHVGSIIELIDHWNIPVFAHSLEYPYLVGEREYPEPDTSVEGGYIAKISSLFPNEPINIKEHLKPLPSDGTVPFLDEFRWIPTPGHTPGHVSFFRDKDRSLIAGDAFITVRQDSLYKTLTQEKEINGPPRYLTTDWDLAYESVKVIRDLKPVAAITGHGVPMSGSELTTSLEKLVTEFKEVSIPDYGKYVNENGPLH
ncbi:MBL fold metallo-hydrolase [Bacillus sp. FJAT-45037]|uniref:MBL fold metallo-hydrolase n=1 Tax=Bacillus sp. FJAT-45037 TaxID=2011007 RepID=UPI000C24FF31|nr:MBL fold metallo-hydrolase [Bacillus sp. FJAT-45037]